MARELGKTLVDGRLVRRVATICHASAQTVHGVGIAIPILCRR